MIAENALPQHPHLSRETKKPVRTLSLFRPVPLSASRCSSSSQHVPSTAVLWLGAWWQAEDKRWKTIPLCPASIRPAQTALAALKGEHNEVLSVRKASLPTWQIPSHKPEPQRNPMPFYPETLQESEQ